MMQVWPSRILTKILICWNDFTSSVVSNKISNWHEMIMKNFVSHSNMLCDFQKHFWWQFYAIWNNWILVYRNTTRTITVCRWKPWRGTHFWGWHALQDKQRLGWSRLKGCVWLGVFSSNINRTRKKIYSNDWKSYKTL